MCEFKRIVCPTDFSEGAALAVSQASELAQQSVQKVRRRWLRFVPHFYRQPFSQSLRTLGRVVEHLGAMRGL